MKAAIIVAAATASSVNAYTAPLFVANGWTSKCAARTTTDLHISALLEMEEVEVAVPQSSGPAKTGPSRFDRMKKNWKGIVHNVDAQALDVSYEDFATLLAEQKVSFLKGEIVKGTVAQTDDTGALVEIGGKSGAFLPLREYSLVPMEKEEAVNFLEVDEEKEFMIVSDENADGQVIVSLRRLEFEQAWERVQSMHAQDALFEGEICTVNRGGAIVMVEGLRAFLPGSHLCGGLPTEELVGKSMKFKFLEVNFATNKLVVSNRRAVLEDEMQEISRGDVVEGTIKAIKPYGAFVEYRGLSGLLHISQVSYDRIEELGSILQLGMAIKCMIIDHDKINGRIALSTKTLEPEPGDMLRNPQKVYDLAEETAKKYHERMEAERKAREEAAKSIVMGLGDGLVDSFDSDMLSGIADGIESVLNPVAPFVTSDVE